MSDTYLKLHDHCTSYYLELAGSASISLYLCWKFSSEVGSYCINDYRVNTTPVLGMVMLAIDLHHPRLRNWTVVIPSHSSEYFPNFGGSDNCVKFWTFTLQTILQVSCEFAGLENPVNLLGLSSKVWTVRKRSESFILGEKPQQHINQTINMSIPREQDFSILEFKVVNSGLKVKVIDFIHYNICTTVWTWNERNRELGKFQSVKYWLGNTVFKSRRWP